MKASFEFNPKKFILTLEKDIDNDWEKKIDAIVEGMLWVGETCIRDQRIVANFTDQTGNLRSSIGYVVLVDGVVINRSSFESIKQGKEGANEGLLYAQRIASQYKTGIVLIIVAGMNYASYVSAKGYNVIDTAHLIAENMINSLLKTITQNDKNR